MSMMYKVLTVIVLVQLVSYASCQSATALKNLKPLYYDYEGRDNNINNPDAGRWDREVSRAHYDPAWRYNFVDGMEEVSFADVNPRALSNELGSYQPIKPENKRGVNTLHMAWGAYIGHDLARYGPRDNQYGSLSVALPQKDTNNAYAPILSGEVPAFDTSKLNFTIPRCKPQPGYVKGTTPRNYMSFGTPWFELEAFYGKNYTNVVATVNETTGLFLTDASGLPVNKTTFGATDVTLKVLFGRIHNYYANELLKRKPDATPNELFNEGRRWAIAHYQSITFYEYAPIIFDGPMPVYQGYNSSVVPVYTAEIGPIAVHYPYSEFTGQYDLRDENLELITHSRDNRPFMLSTSAWEQIARKYGLEAIVRGAIGHVQGNVDLFWAPDMRANQYGTQTSDAFTRLFMRSRENGIPTYNNVRRAWGLAPKTTWESLSPNLDANQIAILKKYYSDIEKLDTFVGMHAEWDEDHHMGELFRVIYKPYWVASRDGDRFWFEGDAANFTTSEKEMLRNTKISDLLIKFFNLTRVPCSAFYAREPDCPSRPPVVDCPNAEPNTVSMINDKLLLKWEAVTNNSVRFHVQAATTGFVAVGLPSTPGKMIGTTAFIGTASGSSGSVDVYTINARAVCTPKLQGVCKNTTTPYTISDVVAQETDSTTDLWYTVTGIVPGDYDFVASFGSSDTLGYHEDNKGVTKLTIKPAAGTTTAPTVAPSSGPVPTCPANTASSISFSFFLSLLLVLLALF